MAPSDGQLSREEFLAHIEPLRARLDELVELQRVANGRTGKLETRVAILEDRSPGRSGGLWGSIVAALLVGMAEAIRQVLGRS